MDPVSNACDELFDRTAGRLLIAFSGGMDSMVLAHALAQTAKRRGGYGRIEAIHIDHGIHPDSARWSALCEARAAALGIRFEAHSLVVPPGSNLEARARAARYRVFESLLGEDDVLLLAHHAGDQTESLLLHLFQGRGLYGMPNARDLGPGRLMRPLLNLPRQTLSGYARAHQLEWIEDPSNSDLNLDRNFLRRRLLPMLLERFDGLPRRLARVAHAVADMGTALDELAGLDRHPLPLEVFDGLSQPARIALLRRWLAGKDAAAGVTHRALVEFLRQLDAANDRYPSLGLASGDLVRYRRALYLVPPPPELDPSYPVSIPGRLDLPHCGVEFRVQPAVAEPGGAVTASGYDESVGTTMLVPPVVVTFATALEPGAEVYHRGHRRSIRTLMREAGVAPWLRDRLPVIADRVGIALIPGVWRREPDAALDSQPRSGGDRPALTEVRYRAGGPIMRWGMR